MRTVLPEQRRGKLKKLIEDQKKIKAVETVCGLEALAVTEAENQSGNIFEAMWFSGLCCAAFKGMPDNEYTDFSDKIRDIENIFAVSDKPVIADMDTGGTVPHFCRHICELERIGVSGIVAEDKTGLKDVIFLLSAQWDIHLRLHLESVWVQIKRYTVLTETGHF